jgi:membrane protease YdiL (CAAX protease family)
MMMQTEIANRAGLFVLFLLALAWGYAIQKTGGLLGSVFFHAGGDLLIINGFIAALHGGDTS